MATEYSAQRIKGLELFRSLVKDGCTWEGDVLSKKWSECLEFEEGDEDRVKQTLSAYEEGVDYKMDGYSVWIC